MSALFIPRAAADLTNGTTGTGTVVLATSPTLVTPTLGAATATSVNKLTLTVPATSATLTIADGKTLTANHSLTLAGTDGTTMTFPSTSATLARTDAAQSFTGLQTLNGGAAVPSGTMALASVAAPTTGIQFISGGSLGNGIGLYTSGALRGVIGNGMECGAGGTYSWNSSGNPTGSPDLILTREAAATLQMGSDAAGVTNQTFKACDRITTDGAGADLTVAAGRNRGASSGGSLIFQTSPPAGAGVTGTLTTRLTIDTNGIATFAVPPKLPGYTVATLPATAATGMVTGAMAYVTDATAPTYLAALTGGGAVTCPVFYNGAAWVSN